MKRKRRNPKVQRSAPPHPSAAPKRSLARISYIDPAKLVTDESDKVGLFFLMLSVVFNDIRDLAELALYVQKCGKSKAGSARLEQYDLRGRHIMLHRFIAGTLHELMKLIYKERSVLEMLEFKEVAARLPAEALSLWDEIVGIALAPDNEANISSATKRTLVSVRNSTSFHYYALNSLAKGWEPFRKSGQMAPYSMGSSAPETRFYYADAVLIQMMEDNANRFLRPTVDPPFDRLFLEVMYKANQALAPLLRLFLEKRAAAT